MNSLALVEDCLGLDALQQRHVRRSALPPTNPSDWKAGLALEIEILLFIVLVFGIDHCGLLTLIFQHRRNGPPVSPRHAQTLFKNAWRHLLPKFFAAYVSVMDFHRSGQIHLHLVVALHINIRAGWDFEIDDEHRGLQKFIRDERRRATPDELRQLRLLARRLTSNPEIKSLFSQLRRGLRQLGFAKDYPFELKPVRHPRKLASYLARRFLESRAARHLRPAYSRCRRFSHRYKRHVDQKLRFSAVGTTATLYRAKKAAVGRAFGITDIGHMIQEFGSSWEHQFHEIFHPVNQHDREGFFSWQLTALSERVKEWNARHEYVWVDSRDIIRQDMEREAMDFKLRSLPLPPSTPSATAEVNFVPSGCPNYGKIPRTERDGAIATSEAPLTRGSDACIATEPTLRRNPEQSHPAPSNYRRKF
jgi:hypothetical protein